MRIVETKILWGSTLTYPLSVSYRSVPGDEEAWRRATFTMPSSKGWRSRSRARGRRRSTRPDRQNQREPHFVVTSTCRGNAGICQDARNKLRAWLAAHPSPYYRFSEVDTETRLAPGTAKRLLVAVARELHWAVVSKPSVSKVYGPPFRRAYAADNDLFLAKDRCLNHCNLRDVWPKDNVLCLRNTDRLRLCLSPLKSNRMKRFSL